MNGTVRERKRKNKNGVSTSAWMVDYYDRSQKRQRKQFKTKQEATAYLNRVQRNSEIWIRPQQRESDYPDDVQKRLSVGALALRLDHALARIERLLTRLGAT